MPLTKYQEQMRGGFSRKINSPLAVQLCLPCKTLYHKFSNLQALQVGCHAGEEVLFKKQKLQYNEAYPEDDIGCSELQSAFFKHIMQLGKYTLSLLVNNQFQITG